MSLLKLVTNLINTRLQLDGSILGVSDGSSSTVTPGPSGMEDNLLLENGDHFLLQFSDGGTLVFEGT